MPVSFTLKKSKELASRSLGILPRIGLVVDFAGFKLEWKQAPLLETVLNLRKSRFSLANLTSEGKRQLQEIEFDLDAPEGGTGPAVVQSIRSVRGAGKPRPGKVKKAQSKAASRRAAGAGPGSPRS